MSPEVVDAFVFRDPHFAPAGDTVVCIADRRQMKPYMKKGELGSLFAGYVVFRDRPWPWGRSYLGVWGKRNASKFRRLLRERGANVRVVDHAPPGIRIAYFTTCG